MNINPSLHIMFVKKFAFVIMISINLKFRTDEFIPKNRQEGILVAIEEN